MAIGRRGKQPRFRRLTDYLLDRQRENEFLVGTDDFAALEIRQKDESEFFYFFNTKSNRLIKRFILREGPRVDTLCDVVLIQKQDQFSPRLKLWKRDKSTTFSKDLTEEEAVSEAGQVLIKARVDVTDCHENFWLLIHFLQTYRDVQVPEHDFRITSGENVQLLDALKGHDKNAVLSAVGTYLSGQVTESDVEMLLDRRRTLERFEKLLKDDPFFSQERTATSTTPEGLWQQFFEANSWIFGYGLTLVACENYDDEKLEQMTSGQNLFTGGGKRSDAVMRTKGFLQSILFAEIKRHDTDLLMEKAYREPDVYQPSKEVSGAVAQVQKTAHKAVSKLEDLHRQNDPSGEYQFEVSTVRPRQIVVAGRLEQLADGDQINVEKMSSFELWRRGHSDVEIVTFDELYERTKFIVESQESGAADDDA